MWKSIEIKPGDTSLVGRRVRLMGGHSQVEFVEVLYVGKEILVGKFSGGGEYSYKPHGSNWLIWEEPKVKRLAPALCKGDKAFYISQDLFESEEKARGCFTFHSWPAPPPDKDGFRTIPEVEGE